MSRGTVTVVPAVPGDGAELARLEAACFAHPRSETALREEIGQPERYLLLACKWQGQLEGYVGLEYVLDEGYITDLAVFPRYRRHGVGTALLRELERRGRELGLRFLTLEVRPSNAAALGLYRAMGYWEAGRRRDFYTDPREDALLLTKYLKNDNTEGI